MQFTLYSQKTTRQCVKDLTERLQARGTKANPALGGWVNKDGGFSLTLTAPVLGRFNRTTRLRGRLWRETGVTVIEGYVPDGISPFWMRVLGASLIVGSLLLAVSYGVLIGLVMVLFGLLAYIPLRGDYLNSDQLLVAIERTLKADPKPPKK
ncbi:MAG: hypothetical protein EA396_09765 [Anaerolineaceae bacterium]|nr:MAG: hypothetical protein EA396_09765 [Anaerolineaceae bacterium]